MPYPCAADILLHQGVLRRSLGLLTVSLVQLPTAKLLHTLYALEIDEHLLGIRARLQGKLFKCEVELLSVVTLVKLT